MSVQRPPADAAAVSARNQRPHRRGGADERTRDPARPGRRRVSQPDPARDVALSALRAVAEGDAYANLVLPGLLRRARVTGRDAAFATGLVYGTLRALGILDAVVGACLDRALDQLDPPIPQVLRLGAYQLLVLETPAHAAVSTSVDLARRAHGPGVARLVNAVLRRVAEQSLTEWVARLAPDRETDPVGYLALAGWHPRWIVSAFRDALGGSLPQTAAALAADNAAPRVTLAARPGRISQAELLADAAAAGTQVPDSRAPQPDPDEAVLPEGSQVPGDARLPDDAERAAARPGRWSGLAVVLSRGDPAALSAVRDGRAGVQDEGSQLVALALAEAPTIGTDTGWWLDACAGPGGKAAVLSGLAAARGARLLAGELQPHRARLVHGALRGTPGAVAVIADATAPAWADGTFDRVLLDAPCSGLGSLRRRPEARWRRNPTDLPGLRAQQTALLRAALHAVRPGGVVGYATCSPHPAETSVVVGDVVRALHRTGSIGIERLRAAELLPPGLQLDPDAQDAQLWPHRHGTDAMFLALLRRVD